MVATHVAGLAVAIGAVMAGAGAGDSPGVPTSTVQAISARTAHYCVTGYAPNDSVTVRNERTGATAAIHTTIRGVGCTDVSVEVHCGEAVRQTIVAAGVGADGNPGLSSAQAVVPGNTPPCSATAADSGQGDASGGLLSSTGAKVAVFSGAGVGAACLAVIGIVLVRRRRRAAAG